MTDFALLYEELRKVIDGGSESMTHEDAVKEVTDLHDEIERLTRERDDLAMMLRRVLRSSPSPLKPNALDLLARLGLDGSPLRSE